MLMKRKMSMEELKDMCMDMEDKYVDLSIDNVNDCEHIEEYFKNE